VGPIDLLKQFDTRRSISENFLLNQKNTIRPTQKTRRIELLDVYRGFAVFGIFVVNIVVMHSTYLNQDVYNAQWTTSIDLWTQRILQLLFYTKFFPIFSLLFGWGMSMQALKMKARQGISFSFFVRRMGYLWLFGILHIALLWSGDVLHLYAVMGLLVTPLITQRRALLLGMSIFFLLFPFYEPLISFVMEQVPFSTEEALASYDAEAVRQVIQHGSFTDGMELRFREYVANLPMLLGFLAPMAFSMFLLGMYLGKKNVHNTLFSFLYKIKNPILLFTILSNAYRLVFLFVLPDYELYRDPDLRPYFIKLMVLSDVFMGIFYLWLIGWLWFRRMGRSILSPLRHVGRMALTNYLLQSFIGVILFTSLGFRLYETLRPFETFLIAIVIFVFQIGFSKIWLQYFRWGPLEWMWRCTTYRKLLPLKKS
tara:strand:- start:3537 stop:4811 length:1275 start_codon:yes stop_codon:yes gene_type:complete